MIRKIIYILIIIALFALAAALIFVAPYHIYTTTLTEGVETRFLTMNPSVKEMFDGRVIENKEPEEMNDRSLFSPFHFGHFNLSLPYNHSIYSMIPIIRIETQTPRLGGSFQNSNNIEYFSFMMEKPYRFEASMGEQKLFKLPIFYNYINKKSFNEFWEDLFSRNLILPSNEGKSFVESFLSLKEVSYKELVYNLYILYNRHELIKDDVNSLSFDIGKQLGIIELKNKDDLYKEERIYLVREGFIYPIYIRTRIRDINAQHFRSKFISGLEYEASSKDSAIPIYAKYKQISFQKRLDQQGMMYLYAAWSHDLDNKEYIRMTINFLERGKLNLKYLKPFYEFSYKKFGSSFASVSDYLQENAEETLKRKMQQELESELSQHGREDRTRFEGKFDSDDEKIEFNLQRAKDKNIDVDKDSKMLLME